MTARGSPAIRLKHKLAAAALVPAPFAAVLTWMAWQDAAMERLHRHGCETAKVSCSSVRKISKSPIIADSGAAQSFRVLVDDFGAYKKLAALLEGPLGYHWSVEAWLKDAEAYLAFMDFTAGFEAAATPDAKLAAFARFKPRLGRQYIKQITKTHQARLLGESFRQAFYATAGNPTRLHAEMFLAFGSRKPGGRELHALFDRLRSDPDAVFVGALIYGRGFALRHGRLPVAKGAGPHFDQDGKSTVLDTKYFVRRQMPGNTETRFTLAQEKHWRHFKVLDRNGKVIHERRSTWTDPPIPSGGDLKSQIDAWKKARTGRNESVVKNNMAVDLPVLKTGWAPIEQPDGFIYRNITDDRLANTIAGNFHYACFQLLLGNDRIGLKSFEALLDNRHETDHHRMAQDLLAGRAKALFASLPVLRPSARE